MKETNDLRQGLMEAPNLDSFLSENLDSFQNTTACDTLCRLFQKSRLSKATLAKRSGMSEVYLHQVFSGRRNPSRSRLICLCFGLKATIAETQSMLKQCGYAELYPKNKRDAIILFGFLHNKTLFEVNDMLYDQEEETLF